MGVCSRAKTLGRECMGEPELTVEFDQSEQDVLEFQRHHVRRSNQRWRMILPPVVAMAGGLVLGLMAGLLAWIDSSGAYFITLSAVVLAGVGCLMLLYNWFALPSLATWRTLSSREQRTMLIGPRALTIGEGGLAWRYPAGESSVGWSGVNRIEVDSTGVYFYFSVNNAVWVPQRAFQSAQQSEAFVQHARDWLVAARGYSATPA